MNDLIEKRIVECYTTIDGFHKTFGEPIADLLNNWAEKFYNLLEHEHRKIISIDQFKERVLEYTKPKEPPKVLKDIKIEPWLDPIWRSNDKTRWNNYKKLLENEGKAKLVSQLDADTFAILDNCYNPKLKGQWERRGLVYGHVQSGKTANYIGLVNKAFDVGYRIVIILTGMTEDLRRQTQDRVNSGVIGTDEDGQAIGVGLLPTHKHGIIKAGTNIKFDLKSGNIDQMVTTLGLDQNIVFVVKKNVSVLKCLITWLYKKSKAQDPDQYKINDVPFLIIDDEADNASIQSMSKNDFELQQEGLDIRDLLDKDEGDLTNEELLKLESARKATLKAINRNIRICLSLIGQKSFVAYTATPYSVISQRSEDLGREFEMDNIKFRIDENSDLFPEHFIIPLDPGVKYMGIEKIFGSKKTEGLPVLTIIPNTDQDYFPTGKEPYSFRSIPNSLEQSIIHFIVAIYVRESRGQKQHNTMLVHTSHKVEKIDYVANKIDKYLERLKDNLKSNPSLIEKFIKQLELIRSNSKDPLFEKHFEADLSRYTVPISINSENIYSIIDKISLVSYHSKTNDPSLKHKNHKLNYPNLEKEPDKPQTYIVVGGNRIARGFTLEGLTTSYFAREAGSQDTLYQMGRWFGYRIGYEDTIQIFMAKDQLNWFNDILSLELDLRNDLAQMNENEMTPSIWEIKMVNTSSFEDLNRKLRICDPARLRNTQSKLLSFGGTNQQTKLIKRDLKTQASNLEITKRFLNKLSGLYCMVKSNLYPKEHNINFSKVNPDLIVEFISEFRFEDEIFDTVIEFIKANKNEFASFSVVLKQNEFKNDMKISPEWKINDKCGIITKQNVTSIKRNDKEEGNGEYFVPKTLLDKDLDNTFDLFEDPQLIEEYKKADDENKGPAYRYKLRNESKKAILIIYLIKGKIVNEAKQVIFPALYLSLPNVGNQVNYTVRKRKNI
jgi:hypothetical protein